MDKIYVAKIGKTVGLKGSQKLHIDSDFPEQFKKNTKLTTDKNKELIIESFNPNNNTIKFIGIDDVESAKKLTNRQLFISKEDTLDSCILGEKEFFWFDMIDCTIEENGEVLGVVEDIQRLPLSDYLQIKTTADLINKRYANSFLIPYLDRYIIEVDMKNKKIQVANSKEILEAS